jgi:hypothetical protein
MPGDRPESAIPAEAWVVAQGERNGKPLLLRFNEGAPAAKERPRWPVRVGVAVRFREADGNGFPGAADSPVLDGIEEAIATVLAERGAMFAFVVTTGGMREFVAYVSEHDDGRAVTEAAQAAGQGWQLQAYGRGDPAWEGYDEFGP